MRDKFDTNFVVDGLLVVFVALLATLSNDDAIVLAVDGDCEFC